MADSTGIKAWRIDLKPYKAMVQVRDSDGEPVYRNGLPVTREDTIDVRHNLCTMLFNPSLRLNPDSMFQTKDIVDRIRQTQIGYVILDAAEMDYVKKAYNALVGLPEQFIEFLTRIRDAEQVNLEEATRE